MKQKSILAIGTTTICLAYLLQAVAADPEAGFKQIFNGQDLAGWDGNRTLWSVKDGVIVGQTTTEHSTKGNTFLIWTNGSVGDFELRFAYKITPNNDKGFANSGVQYRSKILEPANWVVGGYQADFEAGNTYSGILYEEKMRGILAERGQKVIVKEADGKTVKEVTGSVGDSAEIQAAIKKDGWNDYVIIAQGNHLQHFINGHQTVDVTDEAGMKTAKSGLLALQLHAGPPMTVEFKNIRIKAGTTPANPKNAAAGQFDGTWQIVASEADGVKIPLEDSAGVTLTVAGEKFSVTKDGKSAQGSFSFDASKTPNEMDFQHETGFGAGKLFHAIYEFSEDNLRVCYATQEGSRRPTSFKTAPDSAEVMITYKRKEP